MIWGRVLDVFRRRRLDADLDAQLAYHVDALEAEFLAKALAPDEAVPRRAEPSAEWRRSKTPIAIS